MGSNQDVLSKFYRVGHFKIETKTILFSFLQTSVCFSLVLVYVKDAKDNKLIEITVMIMNFLSGNIKTNLYKMNKHLHKI